MPRDSHIPIFLWVAMAVLVHLCSGGGLEEGARTAEQRELVREFANAVRSHVRTRLEPPIEVTLLEEEAPEEEVTAPEPPKHDSTPDAAEPRTESVKRVHDDAKPLPELKKPEEKPKPEPEAKKPDEKTPKPAEKKEEEKKALPLPVVAVQNRIAVKQNVKDKTQSNPNAALIADNANQVAEETQARITSTNQDDPAPNPGTHLGGPKEAEGDADENELAQSEDKPGAEQASVKPAPAAKRAQKANDLALKVEKEVKAQKAQTGHLAQDATPEIPDTLRANGGSFAMAEAQAARESKLAQKQRQARRAQRVTDFLGLGATGTTENGVNLNLAPSTALAAIGEAQLRTDREHDAEQRRSRHRGSFQTIGLEKWRSAIENYVPSVKFGNTTALNTAAVPFASYLNAIHNRIHPVYAIHFLGSLDRLPSDHVMNGPDLSTDLEIVLDQESGKLVRMGVTKTSGVTAFDVAALQAIQQSQPFGPPPKEIVSPDGRVYLHWEFYRNPFYACSTYFARPFMLKAQPKPAPPSVDEPVRPPFQELPAPEEKEQHGSLWGHPGRKRDVVAQLW